MVCLLLSSGWLSLLREVGEGGTLSEIDTQSTSGTDVGESDIERAPGFANLCGLHGTAGEVLPFIVGRTGGDGFFDHQTPMILAGNFIQAVGTDRNCRAAASQLGFCKQRPRPSAPSQG